MMRDELNEGRAKRREMNLDARDVTTLFSLCM